MTPQLMTWLAMLAFLIGIIALVLEIFILPGFGVAGMAGLILVGWGVLLLAVDFTQATAALVVALVATVVIFFLGLKLFGKFKLWQRMTLVTKQYKETGYVSSQSELALFIGKTGLAMTPLRPAGAVEIDGRRLDVVTEGDFIAPGTRVRVIKVEGTRVVVRTE